MIGERNLVWAKFWTKVRAKHRAKSREVARLFSRWTAVSVDVPVSPLVLLSPGARM